MNRSILIVICDFLLLSLLAFSTVEPEALVRNPPDRAAKLDFKVAGPDNRQELASVMKLALDDERQAREQLLGELTQAREAVARKEAALGEREQQLAARDRQLQAAQQNLQATEQQARRLTEDKSSLQQQAWQLAQEITLLEQKTVRLTRERGALERQSQELVRDKASLEDQGRRLAQEKNALEEQVANTQAQQQDLQRQVEASRAQGEELRKQQERAAALQRQMAMLEQSNRLFQAEQQRLATRLQVVEEGRRAADAQLARMQNEVKVAQEEKASLTRHATQLAEGVQALAATSGELARELRDNRPQAANAIFSQYITNRVHAQFHAFRHGIFGIEVNNRRESHPVLVTDGTNVFALCHVEDTALALANPAPDWEGLSGTLGRGTALLDIESIAFLVVDPRAVLIPVSKAGAAQLGGRVFRIATEPFRFQDAVVVGTREGYYGECRFEIDLQTPHCLRMDRNVLRGLFGKFNPSRGDLVFTKTGELLGLMVNNTYCARLAHFTPAATLRFGQTVQNQHTGEMLSRLYINILQSPARLQ